MIILHGNNIVASRKVLIEQKDQARKKDIEVIGLEGKSLSLTDLKQALESTSLFGQDRLVVIENLFSLPKSKTKEEILDYLKSFSPSRHLGPDPGSIKIPDLIIWEGRQIDGRVLKGLVQKAQIRLFKLPAVIFKFLDSLGPGKPRDSLSFFHQTLKTEAAELVFYMLVRRSRELIIAKDLGKRGLTNSAPWQQIKLLRQAEKFTLKQLLKLHRDLLKIDWQQKTGRAGLPLKSTLDLLILNL